MNRLWVQLSVMIGGTLFSVFLLQFLSIVLEVPPRAPLPGPGAARDDAEIARRLLNFGALSLVVGGTAGALIGWVVGAPIDDLVRAARRLGRGDLSVRVKPRGSREVVELGTTFNRMAADLQRAEEQRRNLMADVSHELRTPLTVLEGHLRAALDGVYGLDEAEVANLYAQTRHLIRLTNDLRELALAEARELPLDRQPTDMAALVDDVVQAIEPMAAEKGVQLVCDLGVCPPADVDPSRIRQVLMNLLSNALRHTPQGGTVTTRACADGNDVCLTVTDTGDGLLPEQLRAVFDRFYRADRARSREAGGTGLGLAIVKAIVEAHGGRVEAQSEGVGRGCTFTVHLPPS